MKNKNTYVLEQLLRMEEEGRYIALSLSAVPREHRGYVTAMLYGITEHKITLDYYIGVLAQRSEMDATTRHLLRIGLYQLLYMDHIPPHAVVNQTVALARNKGEAGFVNAILRTALREPQKCTLPPREKNPRRYLSIAYSVPLALVRELVSSLGEAQTEDFLRASAEKAPLCIRVNTLKTTREAWLTQCKEAGISARPTTFAQNGVLIDQNIPVPTLPGFDEGLFYVQDEAAQLAVEILSPTAGSFLIDTCAAPGGKSFAASLLMEGKGQVVSMDIHTSKKSLISDGAQRLKLENISPITHDSQMPKAEFVGKADYVICDVPCSGVGVLRKKPEIRYKDVSEWANLPALQQSILSASSTYLKPSGKLLYATCTIRPQENREVVKAFLASHPDFSLLPFSFGGISSADGMLTFTPQEHGTDGFFVALLCRKS